MVELRILGTLQLSASDGRDLTALARQSKRTALLCYLAAAVPNGFHRRDTLLALFWPELDETHARASLSQALYVLRNALGDQAIVTRGDAEVGLCRDVVWCDVRAFEAALDAGRPPGEALALYRGDLLSGFSLSDAPEFGRWVDHERERLRERAAEGGWALVEARAGARDVVQAARWARWAAALAPADEVAIRRLMTSLHGLGDRAAALRAYETFADRLTQEYELEPSPETRALADAIRREHPLATAAAGPIEHPVPSAASVRREAPPARRAGLIGAVIGAALVTILGLRAVWPRHDGDAPASAIRRIAVLPLENLTGDTAQEYFVDGIHDALITELAKIGALSVISRTSVLGYRHTTKTAPEIARELHVDAVVEGSVVVAGDSVRINAQLIAGPTDRHLWADTFVKNRRNVLALYADVAQAIAREVRAAVTPEERARLASAPTVDPDVYTLTLKGGYECLLWTEEGLRRGIRLLREAVDRDPTNALAYAKLAGCYSDMSFFGHMPDIEAIPLVKAANARALELDSTVGEAYATRGWFRFVTDRDTNGADQDFRRALELSPGTLRTRQWYGDYLVTVGRFDEAISQKRLAIALDPLSAQSSIGLAATYFYARRYDEAIAQFKRTLNLAPGSYGARMQLAWNYSLQGAHGVAVTQCDSAYALTPPAEKNWLAECGYVYARAGHRAQVLEMLRRNPGSCGNAADVYVGLGDPDHALACLRKEARENPQDLAVQNFNPVLDPLRSDPRTHAVLLELGIRP